MVGCSDPSEAFQISCLQTLQTPGAQKDLFFETKTGRTRIFDFF